MDTSDPDIQFDATGICNHCASYDERVSTFVRTDSSGRQEIESIVGRMKKEGQGKDYDCAIGLSGGVDSSYAAYVAVKEFGLRPLAVHVDGGWNSELAVKNIENIVSKLGIDLYTEVIDWEEMKDLQVAFLKSGVANQDVPQDHAFFAALYREATRQKLRFVISGGNFVTEAVMPFEWAYDAMDLTHLRAIHKRFGARRLTSYPLVNPFMYYLVYPYVKRMEVVRLLNYVDYDKAQAIGTLERELGFRYYGGKHFESRFTKWQQLHYRPTRFGFDERRAYLSTLVLSGQMTRDEALEEIERSGFKPGELERETAYVCDKLGLSPTEMDEIMTSPTKTFRDYPSQYAFLLFRIRLKRIVNRLGIQFKSK